MKRRYSRLPHLPSCVPRYASRYLLVVILLLAFALRCYRLDAQSFWNDEGNSARIAERSLDLILKGAERDIHPPGYYLLLHYWRALFGQTEFALRSLSVAAGLMLVVLTYLLGHQLLGKAPGLGAAFLATISPFGIYYSQEARMYALLAALSAASTYLFLRMLADTLRPNFNLQSLISKNTCLGTIIGYVLVSAAGLYTHYAFAFTLFVHAGIFALWWLAAARRSPRRWRWLALWVATQAAIAILYVPWLPVALVSLTGWAAAGRMYGLGPGLLNVLRTLSVGITLPAEESQALLFGSGLLLLVGLWPTRRFSAGLETGKQMSWFSAASLGTYLLLPVALIFVFDLYKPAWLKFLLVVLPPFHVAVAHGICRLRIAGGREQAHERDLRPPVCILHLAPRILFLVYLVATIPSLRNLYLDPAYARDDYRQIASDISADPRPGDGIILNAPNQWEVFTYYHPDRGVHSAPYRPTPDAVEAFLAPLTERYRRLFVLYWGDAESDPQRLIEASLAVHAYKASDRWYGDVRLATYAVAPLPEEPTTALDARFGETIRLRGYAVEGESLAPGKILPVTLFWQAQAAIPKRYKITVQLLDHTGQLVAQHDTEPGDGLMPTTTWEPDQILADRCGIPLPAGLPPGTYTLIVGLYHVATGERLPVALAGEPIGDHLPLGTVRSAN